LDAYGIGPPVNGDSIYNGALDDGAGVTALLALARVFSQHPQRRSITLLFTTAEEADSSAPRRSSAAVLSRASASSRI